MDPAQPPPPHRPPLARSVGTNGGRHFAGWHHRIGVRSLCRGCADELARVVPDHHGQSATKMRDGEIYVCDDCGRLVAIEG